MNGTTLHTSPDRVRLAELVAHLSGCAAVRALAAVERAAPDTGEELSVDERLSVVARALVDVRHDALAKTA